jgi:phosphate transport system permease protein
MNLSLLLVVTSVMIFIAFLSGRTRSVAQASTLGGIRTLNSLPFYYGVQTAIWCAVPSLALLFLWIVFDDQILRSIVFQSLPDAARQASPDEITLMMSQLSNLAAGADLADAPEHLRAAAERLKDLRALSQWALTAVVLSAAILGAVWAWLRIHPQQRARNNVEFAFRAGLFICSFIAVLTTVGIIMSVLFESARFFSVVPVHEFLFGLEWSPQGAIRKDQVAGSSSFGAVPLFAGTLLIAGVAMLVAVPVGLMSAIFLAEYASRRVRSVVKPALEILAGIPTVVYGFFAALTVAPFIRDVGSDFGLAVSSESALAAGLVMGVMTIPFISSLADDVITAVPQAMRDGALGLGATKSESIKHVVIPSALPGIVGGIMLAVSRAIGETMIVVMAVGLAANLTLNPLESVTTVTVQIVTLLVGDQEFDSPKTLAAFALGLVLFLVTLTLNYIALHIVRRYREQYE